MKKHFTRVLAVALVLAMMIPCLVLPASASLTYRKGGNSVSSSYKNGRYYTNYTKLTLGDDDRNNLLAVAFSQLGYQEGPSAGSYSGTVASKGNYTEFNYNAGNWLDTYSYAWCASFVSWSLYQSRCTDQASYKYACRFNKGDTSCIWKEYSCTAWVSQLSNYTSYYKKSAARGGSYTPIYGDIIFFKNSQGPCHVGIVVYVSGGRVYTIEGNTSSGTGVEANGGGVYFKSYSLSNSKIHGYGRLPYDSDNVSNIDYSGYNPTTGLYMTNGNKSIFASKSTSSTELSVIPQYRMFEVTEVSSDGLFLKTTYDGVTGWVYNSRSKSFVEATHNKRVVQITTTGSSSGDSSTPSTPSAPTTSNGSLVAGKQYTITGTTTHTGSGLTDGVYSNDVNDGTWLGLRDANQSGGYVHVDYDLGAKYNISDAQIHVGVNSTNGIGRPYDLQLQVSDDNKNWVTAYNFTLPTGTWSDGTYSFSASGAGYAGRYIRIKAVNSSWMFINEIVVNGTPYTGETVAPTENESIVYGKTPTITGTTKYNQLSKVTDGIYSADIYDGTWLGLDDKNHNAQGYAHFDFDLGEVYSLSGAKIHFGYHNPDGGIGRPWDLSIFTSDNGSTWSYVKAFDTSTINWDTTAATTFTLSLELEGVTSRYVRVAAVNSSWWFVNEFELYGEKAAVTGETNIISGKVPTITGTTKYNAFSNVTDGKVSTNTADGTWLALDDNNRFDGNYVNVDFNLGGRYSISRAKVYFAYTNEGGIGRPYDLILQSSDDGQNWTDIGYFELPKDLPTGYLTYEVSNVVGVGSYLRFKAVNAGWFFINEIEAYGTVATDDVEPILLGDINGDGAVKTNDYFMLKQIIFGTFNSANAKDGYMERADYTGDGKVTAADYMKLKKDIFYGNV